MAVHCTAVRYITYKWYLLIRAHQIPLKYQMVCAWNWGWLCIDLKSQIFHLRLIQHTDIIWCVLGVGLELFWFWISDWFKIQISDGVCLELGLELDWFNPAVHSLHCWRLLHPSLRAIIIWYQQHNALFLLWGLKIQLYVDTVAAFSFYIGSIKDANWASKTR